MLKFTAILGDSSDNVRIDPVASHYMTNFTTAARTHTYTVNVYFNNHLQGSSRLLVR
jgi:hypothetical protein